jgi:hypothetical protein
MGEMRRFWILVLYMGAAQATVNVPVWFASGQGLSSHVYLAIISAFSVLVFAVLARVSHAGAQASSYVHFLQAEFLFTVGEAVIAVVVSLAGATGAGLAVGLAAAAALFAVAATCDLPARSYLLDFVSRRIFRQHLSPGFGLPDSDFGQADIRRVVPRPYPPAAADGDGSRPRGEPGQRGERDGTPSDGPAEDLARATAWAEGLLAVANAAGAPQRMPSPVTTSVGFVQSRDDGAKLAVIHYFRPRQLFKALLTMPKSVPFAGRSFPIVARPWQPVEHGGPSPSRKDSRGRDGHCWVTFGKDGKGHGVVTAAHVIAPDNAATGSKVRADISRTPKTPGVLRAKSTIMDAALIDMSAYPRPDFTPAPHSKVPGYKPVRLCSGRGPVDGLVLELLGFIGGEFTRRPDGEPDLRAMMVFNVAGQPGDSGCLVLDLEFERGGTVAPYLMYHGVIQLADRQAGRGVFLDQVAYHWQVDFQFTLPPPLSADDSATASAGGSATGKASRPTTQARGDNGGTTARPPREMAPPRAVAPRKVVGPTAPVRERGIGL